MAGELRKEKEAAVPEMSERRRSRRELPKAFNNYYQRRSAIIKALTTDLYEFLRQCSAENEVCLYGHPDGKWEVVAPPRPPVNRVAEEVEFPGVPPPAGGINWARKNMCLNEWLYCVASQSDIWLISLTLYPFQIRSIKNRLFRTIKSLPTAAKIVSLIYNFNPIAALVLSPPSLPSGVLPTVDDAFQLYSAHRAALIKALTTDVKSFIRQCTPGNDRLYLHGHGDGNWEVSEERKQTTITYGNRMTTIGIKLWTIDGMITQNQWFFVFLTALKCDIWLYHKAFRSLLTQYFTQSERKEFYEKVNELQSVMGVINEQITQHINRCKCSCSCRL